MSDQQDTVKVTIDGVEIQAPRNAMLIEVADQAGINIPRFCYHKHLSVAANCRMCMVEVEKAPKPLPACATPVADGMQVHTRSALALDAQKGTMEFLLINHPLDCPVCDQGGECELQDVAVGYGSDIGRFNERKRVVEDKNIGPLVSTDMTRCIHCTRCVRFGSEIAGVSELGATGRGEFMEIGTYVEKSLSSELSGNVIDLCPVGALNAKPSRMRARAWEMVTHENISAHDSFGSNISMHTLRDEVIRVVPKENTELNETWISDRDRFSYEGLYSDNRLQQVMKKSSSEWHISDWSDAIEQVAQSLKEFNPEDIGFLLSANQTNEELYLAQKLARGLGVNNIDHRVQQTDFSAQNDDPIFPWLGMNIDDIETQDLIVVIGSDLRSEQPMLAHRVRKAASKGAKVVVINPVQTDWHMQLAAHELVLPQQMLSRLLALLSSLNELSDVKLLAGLEEKLQAPEASLKEFAGMLLNAKNSCVLIGQLMQQDKNFSALRAVSYWIAQSSHSKFGYVSLESNACGAALMGALPHRQAMGVTIAEPGMDYQQMIESPRKVYVLIGLQPEWDCALPAKTLNALNQADVVIALSSFVTEAMYEYCDWLLPISCYAEVEGTKVNMEGRWQSCKKVVNAVGEAKEGWKILRMLGAALELKDFGYLSLDNVRAEIASMTDESFEFSNKLSSVPIIGSDINDHDAIHCVTSLPIYSVDALVRNATSLQEAQGLQEASAHINSSDIKKYNLVAGKWVKVIQGEESGIFQCIADDNVLPGSIYIERALPRSEKLGAITGPVELKNLSVT